MLIQAEIDCDIRRPQLQLQLQLRLRLQFQLLCRSGFWVWRIRWTWPLAANLIRNLQCVEFISEWFKALGFRLNQNKTHTFSHFAA